MYLKKKPGKNYFFKSQTGKAILIVIPNPDTDKEQLGEFKLPKNKNILHEKNTIESTKKNWEI